MPPWSASKPELFSCICRVSVTLVGVANTDYTLLTDTNTIELTPKPSSNEMATSLPTLPLILITLLRTLPKSEIP